MDINTLFLILLVITVIALGFLQFRKTSGDSNILSVPLHNLTQSINQSQCPHLWCYH